ncbi:MAG: CPBP family intramembrane metalloprotease [Flavobacteriales bacterium]|nr:CPBP family intramembrane metalloprotease [Flavobacteriales bacterium]
MQKSKLALLLTLGWFTLIMFVTVLTMGQNSDLESLGLDGDMAIMIMKISQIFSVLMVFVAPAIGIVFLTNEKLRFLNLHVKPKAILLVLGTLTMVFALPLINYLAEWNSTIQLPEALQGIQSWMEAAEHQAEVLTMKFLEMDSVGDLIMNLIVMAVAAAVCEEIFFRGLMQRLLVKFTKNIHIGIWITAILFSAMHGQFMGFIPRMILGAVLGYLYVWSGSLWVPILGHFVNNGLAVIVAYFIGLETLSPETETIGSEEGQLGFVLASFGLVLAMLSLFYKNKFSDYQTHTN